MRGRRLVRILGVLAVLALGLWSNASLFEGEPKTAFSVGAARATIAQIAQRPHPIGSADNARVRSFLVRELQALGLEVETQSAQVLLDHPRREETSVNAGWPVNIIARWPSGSDAPALGLMSHYDSAATAPGAADAATGTSVILETVRQLRRADFRPVRDIIVILTDGEEVGLLGAQSFVRTHPLAKRLGLVLNFEGRGAGGPVVMFETLPGAGALVRTFAEVAPRPLSSSANVAIYRAMPNDTDATMLASRGIAFLNFAFLDDYHRYHHPSDTPEGVWQSTIQQMGDNALALTRHFASQPLPPSAAEGTFFNVGNRLVQWPQLVTALLALAGLTLSLAAAIRQRRAQGSALRGLAQALLFGLTLLGTAGLLASLAFTAGAWPDDWRLLYRLWWVLGALVLLSGAWTLWFLERPRPAAVLAAGLLVVGVLMNWIPTAALLAVASLAWFIYRPRVPDPKLARITMAGLFSLVALAALWRAPGVAYLFAAPAALAATYAAFGHFVLYLLLLLGVVVLWVVMLYAAALALAPGLPGLCIALLFALAALVGLPSARPHQRRAMWVAPGAALVGAALLAYTMVSLPPESEWPQPSHLFTGLDTDTGEAWALLHADEVPDELADKYAWAGVADEEDWGFRRLRFHRAPIPASPMQRLPLSLGITRRDDTWVYRLDLRIPRGAERVRLQFPSADWLAGELNGQSVPLPSPSSPWAWQLWATDQPLALELTASMPVTGRLSYVVVERPQWQRAAAWGLGGTVLTRGSLPLE